MSAEIKLIKFFLLLNMTCGRFKSSGGEHFPSQSVFLTLAIPRTNLDQTEVKGVLLLKRALYDTLLCLRRVSSISL